MLLAHVFDECGAEVVRSGVVIAAKPCNTLQTGCAHKHDGARDVGGDNVSVAMGATAAARLADSLTRGSAHSAKRNSPAGAAQDTEVSLDARPTRSERMRALTLCTEWHLAQCECAQALRLVTAALRQQRRGSDLWQAAEWPALYKLAAAATLACAASHTAQPSKPSWPDSSAAIDDASTECGDEGSQGGEMSRCEQAVQHYFGMPTATQRAVCLQHWPQGLQASVLAGVAAARGDLAAHVVMALTAELSRDRSGSHASGAASKLATCASAAIDASGSALPGGNRLLGASSGAVAGVCQALQQRTYERAVPLLAALVDLPPDSIAPAGAPLQLCSQSTKHGAQDAAAYAAVQTALQDALSAARGGRADESAVSAALRLLPAVQALQSALQAAQQGHQRDGGVLQAAVLSVVGLRWMVGVLQGHAAAAPQEHASSAEAAPDKHASNDVGTLCPPFAASWCVSVQHLLVQLCKAAGHIKGVGPELQRCAATLGSQVDGTQQGCTEQAAARARAQPPSASVCSGSRAANVLRLTQALCTGEAASFAAAAHDLKEQLPESRHVGLFAPGILASSACSQERYARVTECLVATPDALGSPAGDRALRTDVAWLAHGSEDRWQTARCPQLQCIPRPYVMHAVASRVLARPDGTQQVQRLCDHWQTALTALRNEGVALSAEASGAENVRTAAGEHTPLEALQCQLDAVRCANLLQRAADAVIAAVSGGGTAVNEQRGAAQPDSATAEAGRSSAGAHLREWLVALAAAITKGNSTETVDARSQPGATPSSPAATAAHTAESAEAVLARPPPRGSGTVAAEASTTPPPAKRPRVHPAATAARDAEAAEWAAAVQERSGSCALVRTMCGVLQAAMRLRCATYPSVLEPAVDAAGAASYSDHDAHGHTVPAQVKAAQDGAGGVMNTHPQDSAARRHRYASSAWAPVIGVLAAACHPVTSACCAARGLQGDGVAAVRALTPAAAFELHEVAVRWMASGELVRVRTLREWGKEKAREHVAHTSHTSPHAATRNHSRWHRNVHTIVSTRA